MRKILTNHSKSQRINGTTLGKIGTLLNIQDKHNNWLVVGDRVKYGDNIGILLYNYHYKEYGIALEDSNYYGDDIYNIDSYGKFVNIPMDNGGKLTIERLEGVLDDWGS